jgi:cobalt-zinc-cadmium efflux system membrane fusion protein
MELFMNRHLFFGGAAVAAILSAVLFIPVFAHEGHGKVETTSFDLDAPRTVSEQTATVIGLQTAEVDFGKIEDVLRLTGFVRPLPEKVEAISPRVRGVIVAVKFRVGDRVQRGDVAAEIDSPELLKMQSDIVRMEGRLNQLAVEINAAQRSLELAREELRRVESNPDVVAANLLSEKRAAAVTIEGAVRVNEAERAQTEAELNAIRRLVASLRQDNLGSEGGMTPLQLRASTDGVVVERNAVVGAGVEAGQTLLRITDYSVVQIEGELPESMVQRLDSAGGQAARIRTKPDSDSVANGVVRFISPVVDLTKRTTHVVIETENTAGALRDGQFVDIAIVLREIADTVVVPASAIVRDGPMPFVFVKEKDSVFMKRDIVPGAGDDRLVEVITGLVPGDVVVTQGAYSLTQLRPRAVAASPSATKPPTAPRASDGHSHSH